MIPQKCLRHGTKLSWSGTAQLLCHRRAISTTPLRCAERIAPKTHYDFFRKSIPDGPPPAGSFEVDKKSMHKEFLQLQATAHPDRHSQDMKRRAEALSARINEAYKTLLDPLARTQYLLSLRGIDMAEDETAKVDDQGLLMDVLEAQEEIENATEESSLGELASANDERLAGSMKVLAEAFAKDDIPAAKREAVRLRYWTNIRDSIQSWEPGKPITLIH